MLLSDRLTFLGERFNPLMVINKITVNLSLCCQSCSKCFIWKTGKKKETDHRKTLLKLFHLIGYTSGSGEINSVIRRIDTKRNCLLHLCRALQTDIEVRTPPFRAEGSFRGSF